MRIRILVLASTLALASCASLPESQSFADFAEKNKTLTISYPERAVVDINPVCNDGYCQVSESNLTKIMQVITNLNDEVEIRIDAYNQLLTALTHCEYSNYQHERAAQLQKEIAWKEKMIDAGKTVVTFVGMALCLGQGL